MTVSLLAAGVICLLYFAAVMVYTGGTLNAGWIWAAAGGCLLLAGTAFAKGWTNRLPRVLLWGMAVLAGGLCLLLLLLLVRIGCDMTAAEEPSLPYAVVLGAQVKGGRPSKSLAQRLKKALAYAEDQPETVLILSGGKGPGENITEAECMYRYLTEHGLDPSRMVKEENSATTKENLTYSDERTGCASERTGIISNGFHLCRAKMLARRLGYKEPVGLPAPSDPLLLPHFMVREAAAVLLLYLR